MLGCLLCFYIGLLQGFTTLAATASVAAGDDGGLAVTTLNFERGKAITSLEGGTEGFFFLTNDIQIKLAEEAFECRADLRFDGEIVADRVTSTDVDQWALWKLDSFNPQDEKTWMPSPVSNCGRATDHFLGGPCQLAEGRVKRFYLGIPEHKEIRITGRMHFFDDWNGETVTMTLDDKILWSEAYNWCPTLTDTACRKYRIDVCGQEYPDRLSVRIDVSLPHSGDKMALEFSSTLKRDPCEASWGIDDIAVYFR